MPAGSPLRRALERLIQEVLDENADKTIGTLTPVQGTVVTINNDGTVNIVGSDGNYYSSVGYPDPNVVVGTVVLVVTGNGVQAAIPQ
jgi:hypothetical protein